MSEHDLQRMCIDFARDRGYRVISTSHHRRSSASGIPDVFVSKGNENQWTAIDFKSKTGTLTYEQEILAKAGCLAIVRSVEEFVEQLSRMNRGKK